MPGLDDLYKEIILDHYKSPRNRGELETPPAVKAEGFNPLCGDEITVFLKVETDDEGTERVVDVAIGGQGCAISQASASLMSSAVKGKTLAEVDDLTHTMKAQLGIEGAEPREAPLGDIEALKGVGRFPERIKCATLSWNTMTEALEQH